MNGRFEENEALLRRSVPTSSLRRRGEGAGEVRHYGGRESSSSIQEDEPRLPLHRQGNVSEDFFDDNNSDPDKYDQRSARSGGSISSIHLSQHDYRREGRPTNPHDVPRYIEFDASSQVNTRLDNIEQGFRSLLQRQESKPTTKIKVEKRYPKLQRYTSDEALPLIDHSPKGRKVETQNFTQLYTVPPVQKKKAGDDEEEPKWTPRRNLPTRQAQQATTTPSTSLFDRMKELEDQLQIAKRDNNRVDKTQRLQAARQLNKRASRRLGKMLANSSAKRQESTTTFATDRPFLGSLFTGTTNTNTSNTDVFLGEVEVEGTAERIQITKSALSSFQRAESLTKRDGLEQKPQTINEQEEIEKERAALQRLQESGDLSNSLKAFLKEFHESSGGAAPAKGDANKTG